ncbi:MAG: hypothetical protein Ta2B_29190 [Termitinemataceae bacterium]|nr:MAG: hypothetical protein Ta2B_29190 [Termitinemataceae bacterium]
MIIFLLKKTFYDLLDNAVPIAAINLVLIILFAIPVLTANILKSVFNSEIIPVIIVVIDIFICCAYLACVAKEVRKISDYQSLSVKDFVKNIKKNIGKTVIAAIVTSVYLGLLVLTFAFILPFYLLIDSIYSLLFAAFIFWIAIAAIIVFQFLLPVSMRLKKTHINGSHDEGKQRLGMLKKCFALFFDNKSFFAFCTLLGFFLLSLSLLTGFLFPGPAGILLFYDEALRLRLNKYRQPRHSYATSERLRKKYDWKNLLKDDMEKTGNRTFQSIFFPWKNS